MQDNEFVPTKKRVRMHRPERLKPLEVHDETGHLWAISYADFLMVLLSFFVIFFSVEPKQRTSVIQQMKITGTGGAPAQRDAASVDQAQPLSQNLQKLKASINLKYSVQPIDGEKLIIALPDDIFASRAVQLNQKGTSSVSQLLQDLTPFKDDIDITFVGHTDSRGLAGPGLLHDNFDLSVLRATAGLRLALHSGFSPQNVSAQGSADQVRSNRSLSLIVTNKKSGT